MSTSPAVPSAAESHYAAPASVAEAVSLLAADADAAVLAGGTDLIVQLRLGRAQPSVFVDIKRIAELRDIALDEEGLHLGAAVSAAEVFEHDGIRELWPGVAEATDLIGSTQIQGRATWAGNLCNASPAADSVPALIAANARVDIAGPQGERSVPVDGFCSGPGQNLLRAGEFVTRFHLPRPSPRSADAYLRLIPRSEMDIAVVGAAVSLELDADGSVSAARVVLGAVAPTAIVVPSAADALVGTRLDDDSLAQAAAAAQAAASPIDDRRGTIEYRKTVAGVLTKRAARIAYDRAQARS